LKLIKKRVTLKPLEEKDLKTCWEYIYGTPNPEWKKWDAPYFALNHVNFADFVSNYKKNQQSEQEKKQLIIVDKKIIGMVSYYWKYEPTKWLEAGIIIYDPNYWSGDFGTEALNLWVDHLFKTKDIPRVGITTWSGNKRMMRAAEKVGMQLEGRMRKCRYYNGEYYDSIRMGVLREEWEGQK
jgi:RimJ/RimL family protein N-acetyltransferase